MIWFWMFLFYSFFGYLLERMFAKVVQAEKQVRKCFLLLPLCPVYGLAMVTFLGLTEVESYGFVALAFRGALITTIVEFGVHFYYEAVFDVKFWDYSGVAGNIRGRICLPFTAVWGILSATAARIIQPLLLPIAREIPGLLTYAMLLLLTADAVISSALLYRYHDTELLTLRSVGERLEELDQR